MMKDERNTFNLKFTSLESQKQEMQTRLSYEENAHNRERKMINDQIKDFEIKHSKLVNEIKSHKDHKNKMIQME